MTMGVPKSGPHWTQTPKGKKRLSAIMKARGTAKRNKSADVKRGKTSASYMKIRLLVGAMTEESAKALLLKMMIGE